jgi:hypothetical protein
VASSNAFLILERASILLPSRVGLTGVVDMLCCSVVWKIVIGQVKLDFD